jgi:predicted DNA-binding transcriptional regulator AlpA
VKDKNKKIDFDCVRRREEVATILGVSTKTLERLEARGELARVQITNRIVGYRDSEIEKFLARRAAKVVDHV